VKSETPTILILPQSQGSSKKKNKGAGKGLVKRKRDVTDKH